MLTTYIISVSDLYLQIIIIHLPSLKGVILLCDKTCSFFGGGGGGGDVQMCVQMLDIAVYQIDHCSAGIKY